MIRNGEPQRHLAGLLWLVFLAGCPACTERASSDIGAPKPQPVPRSVVQRLEEACGELSKRLMAKLPAGKAVAVVDFAGADGGVRQLGVLAAEALERRILAAGWKVVDRRNLNALLAERDIQIATASGESISRIGELGKADVIVLGTTILAEGEVLLSAKAVEVGSGRVVTTTGSVAVADTGLRPLMWYVRRPSGPKATGELPPLSVRYEFVTPVGSGETKLADGATVRSRQRFKIRLQPNSDCYLYVLLYDSRGQPSVLFPHRKVGLSNRVRGGVSYEVPEGSKWYWFDQHAGVETFYVVGSYTPLQDLAQILAEMREAGGKRAELAGAAREQIETVITRGMSAETAADYKVRGFAVRKRGVNIVDLAGPSGSGQARDTERLDQVVTGYATVVRKVTLLHR